MDCDIIVRHKISTNNRMLVINCLISIKMQDNIFLQMYSVGLCLLLLNFAGNCKEKNIKKNMFRLRNAPFSWVQQKKKNKDL